MRLARRPMTPAERRLIESHPTHTFNALERAGRIPTLTRLVAYQVHERADGRGYPCKRALMFIHPLSRIAALASRSSTATSR